MPSAEMTPGLAISALDFNVGDWVTRYDSAFPGRVVGVHPGIDLVTIEYPTGIEQEDPEYLIVLPVFHDSLGASRHNVLLLSRINQNLRTKALKKASPSDFFIKISREDHLRALGYAFLNSVGKRKVKIAEVIKSKFSKNEWVSFLDNVKRSKKIASGVLKKKILSKTADENVSTPLAPIAPSPPPVNKAPASPTKADPLVPPQPSVAQGSGVPVFVEHTIDQDLPPEFKYTRLKPYARRYYLMNDGRKLKIVANPFIKKFQLILNKRVLAQTEDFLEIDTRFKTIVRKDKRFSD